MKKLKLSVRHGAWLAGFLISFLVGQGVSHAEGAVAATVATSVAAPVAVAPVVAPITTATAPVDASAAIASPLAETTVAPSDAAAAAAKRTEGDAAQPAQENSDVVMLGKDGGSAPTDEFQRYVAKAVGANLSHFGSHLFKGGPSTFAPVDNVPVTSDYVLGPGDELLIRAWGAIDIETRAVIDRNGQINIPKVGTIGMAGVRSSDAEGYLRNKIGRVFRNFELNVTLGQLRSISVYVVGHARRPGTYTLSSLSTLINALFASGGPSPTGTMRHIQLKRSGQLITEIDLYDFVVNGDNSKDARLLPGDMIVIPPAGPRVAVAGSFNAPAIYELKQKQASIREVLDLTGGLSVVTTAQLAALERIDQEQNTPRKVAQFSLDETGMKRLLQDGDILTLFPITPKFDNAITLKGHVASPMRYSWHKGMRVSDLLVDNNALIPNAYWEAQNRGQVNARYSKNEVNWDYATIQRLDQGKLSTKLFAFELGKAILGDAIANVILEPGDIVTVYGWNDALPETENSVLFASDAFGGSKRFVWHKDLRISNVIQNAQWLIDYYDYWHQLKGGGLKRKINWDFATYRRLDLLNLKKKDYSFSLGNALKGNERDNIVLNPGDEVKLYFWDEPTVETEDSVLFSGDAIGGSKRFAWRPGMRIRDVIPDAQWLIDNYDYWNHLKGGGPKRKIDFDFATYRRLDLANLKKKDYSFSLGNALKGSERDNIVLNPGDEVKLYFWDEAPIETDDSLLLTGDAIGGKKRFAWREGMHIRDIIPDAQWLIDYYDFWKNVSGDGKKIEVNWDYANVVRLSPLDLSKNTLPFNLGEAITKPGSQHNLQLRPGDVISLYTNEQIAMPVAKRKLYVSIEGEVAAPGVYQVNPGETLRQVVMRVGGLSPQTYLYGAEFYRGSTRIAQQQKLDEVLDRMERNLAQSASEQTATALSTEDVAAKQASAKFQQQVLAKMRTVKAKGRIVLEMSPTANSVTNIPDLPLEDGDRLYLPPRSSTVQVLGEVRNENAYIYTTNKDVDDYLDLAGGFTENANEGDVYVIKADGSVTAQKGRGWTSGWFRRMSINSGDTIVVPLRTEAKFNLVKELKDWTQILYQIGMGAASLKVLKDL